MKDSGYMDLGLFEHIVNQVSGHAISLNLHHTGEPLLHPKLPEMIKIAKKADVKVQIHTNATLLNQELSIKILESNLDEISFSFDGFDKFSYESIRCNARYEETLNNIYNFLRLKKDGNFKKTFTVFETIIFNKYEQKAIKKKFKNSLVQAGINRFITKSPHNWAGEYNSKNSMNGNNKRIIQCTFPWYAMSIFWNGVVSPCPQDFFGYMKMGDLNYQSISQIWNSDTYQKLRHSFLKINHLNKRCSECDRINRRAICKIPIDSIPLLRNFIYN